MNTRHGFWSLGIALLCAAGSARPARAQVQDTTPKMEIYGFGQADMIFDFRRNDPNWFDVNRPTKLPANSLQFNANGNTWLSARQSRFGVKATLPTRRGDVFANFDFDLFGVG